MAVVREEYQYLELERNRDLLLTWPPSFSYDVGVVAFSFSSLILHHRL